MDWLSRINKAMDYIEDNLAGEVDQVQLAQIMNCSTYQFNRMFALITNVTLSEYIRRRKLTLAAFELISSDIKIVDLALKYGYDSPTAFTRAFINQHNITPSEAKVNGVDLIAFPRMSFHISIRGDVSMNFKIEKKPAFTVVGFKENVSTVNGENNKRIPQIWCEVNQNGMSEQICKLMTAEPMGMLGVCGSFSEETKSFDYYIAVAVKDGTAVPENLSKLEVPESTWAIFKSVGPMPDAIQDVWKRIYSEWFPTSEYKSAGTPELEVYPDGDTTSKDYVCEVWIPVVKK